MRNPQISYLSVSLDLVLPTILAHFRHKALRAEDRVVGLCLYLGLPKILDGLDLRDSRNQAVQGAVRRLAKRGAGCDLQSTVHELQASGSLQAAGGIGRVAALTSLDLIPSIETARSDYGAACAAFDLAKRLVAAIDQLDHGEKPETVNGSLFEGGSA